MRKEDNSLENRIELSRFKKTRVETRRKKFKMIEEMKRGVEQSIVD